MLLGVLEGMGDWWLQLGWVGWRDLIKFKRSLLVGSYPWLSDLIKCGIHPQPPPPVPGSNPRSNLNSPMAVQTRHTHHSTSLWEGLGISLGVIPTVNNAEILPLIPHSCHPTQRSVQTSKWPPSRQPSPKRWWTCAWP